MRYLRRLLRWIGIVLASLAALSVVCVGVVVLPDFRIWLAQPPTDASIVTKALGWTSDDRQLIKRLEADPQPLIALAQNPEATACSPARKLIGRVRLSQPTASQLTTFAALLPQCGASERYGILLLLRSTGELGHLTLASFLASSTPMATDLRNEIVNSVRTDESDTVYAHTIHRRLLAIASDFKVPIENRQAAIEALGRSGKPVDPLIPQLESLAASDSQAFARPVAIALSRIRNTPDPQRLLADLELGQRLDYLPSIIREIGDLGPAAHAIGAEILKELKPLGNDTGPVAALTLARINYHEATPELRTALHCPNDWRLVAAAAEALGRLQSKEAEPELTQVAKNHWDSLVREVARNAIAVIAGKHEYREPMQGTYCLEYDRLQINRQLKAYAANWRPTADAISRAETAERWRKLGEFWVRLISPLITSVTYQHRDGTLSQEVWRHLPRHRIKFAGGLLLGYDEGEFGSGLVFVPARGKPRFLPADNVTQMVPWKDSVLVVTNTAMIGTSMLCRVSPGADGIPRIEPFMRMPDMTTRCTMEDDGSLNFYGHLRLTPDGTLEAVVPAAAATRQ